jgi:hypothetical protein
MHLMRIRDHDRGMDLVLIRVPTGTVVLIFFYGKFPLPGVS